MSKTDALRAIKQARAEAARTTPRPAAARPAARTATPTTTPAPPAAASQDLVPEELCGHQAIGGRRCTRPKGHAEKNHRYAA